MKFNYSQNGPSKKTPPKSWETWLADAPFGPGGKVKRCPVAVGKRTSAGWTVYEIIQSGMRDARDADLSDLMKAGMDRPSAVHVVKPATLQITAFVQKMGSLTESDIGRILAGLR